MKKGFSVASLTVISLSSLLSLTMALEVQASPRREFVEGMLEVGRERREMRREILNADSPEEARREFREGVRAIRRERREMRREIRREIRERF